MEPSEPQAPAAVIEEDVRNLVEEGLRVGFAFSDLPSQLLDDLPDSAFRGRIPAGVLIEMVAGTLQPVADSVGAHIVNDPIRLTGAILDRVLGGSARWRARRGDGSGCAKTVAQ